MVANEKQEFLVHEPLFILLDTASYFRTGIGTGSGETKVNPDETNNTKLTKRLGEVDYTEAESLLNFTTSSANRNRDINTNDFDKSHS